jgi:hypothetical protein
MDKLEAFGLVQLPPFVAKVFPEMTTFDGPARIDVDLNV